MSGVDYSKWDKLSLESSSSDEEHTAQTEQSQSAWIPHASALWTVHSVLESKEVDGHTFKLTQYQNNTIPECTYYDFLHVVSKIIKDEMKDNKRVLTVQWIPCWVPENMNEFNFNFKSWPINKVKEHKTIEGKKYILVNWKTSIVTEAEYLYYLYYVDKVLSNYTEQSKQKYLIQWKDGWMIDPYSSQSSAVNSWWESIIEWMICLLSWDGLVSLCAFFPDHYWYIYWTLAFFHGAFDQITFNILLFANVLIIDGVFWRVAFISFSLGLLWMRPYRQSSMHVLLRWPTYLIFYAFFKFVGTLDVSDWALMVNQERWHTINICDFLVEKCCLAIYIALCIVIELEMMKY